MNKAPDNIMKRYSQINMKKQMWHYKRNKQLYSTNLSRLLDKSLIFVKKKKKVNTLQNTFPAFKII